MRKSFQLVGAVTAFVIATVALSVAHGGGRQQQSAQAGGATPAAVESGPSLFAALDEQLGLKIESRKAQGPVDVIVIEHIERPSEN